LLIGIFGLILGAGHNPYIYLTILRIAVCVVYIGKQLHNTVDLNLKGTLLSPPWSVGADRGNNTDPDEFEVSCPQRRINTTPHPRHPTNKTTDCAGLRDAVTCLLTCG